MRRQPGVVVHVVLTTDPLNARVPLEEPDVQEHGIGRHEPGPCGFELRNPIGRHRPLGRGVGSVVGDHLADAIAENASAGRGQLIKVEGIKTRNDLVAELFGEVIEGLGEALPSRAVEPSIGQQPAQDRRHHRPVVAPRDRDVACGSPGPPLRPRGRSRDPTVRREQLAHHLPSRRRVRPSSRVESRELPVCVSARLRMPRHEDLGQRPRRVVAGLDARIECGEPGENDGDIR